MLEAVISEPAQASLETKSARPARPRVRRSLADRVHEALFELAEREAAILTHEETCWASITFTGTRHEVVLDFQGTQAVAAGEDFIVSLPEHEFRIPGQLVADASVRAVDHRFGADERLIVTCVLLLLEES
ncbi:MAG: hypothetical protein V2I27_05935 [Erythrobacter sp.]|jgi:hypothetical protein|nr:hypothetical protein [Erythrobacter sp.]